MSAPPLRLGFLGVGRIGRDRLRALAVAGAQAAAICDADPEAAEAAAAEAPGCEVVASEDALLDRELDGIVIATPPALHAGQAVRALDRGLAVLCRAPLAESAVEARLVVEAAREADRLLRVDLTYRHAAGVPELRRLVQEGALGRIRAVDLELHDARGPSGDGCALDLGLHLVDLALWVLEFPEVEEVSSVEDHAALALAGGTTVRLACSLGLPARQDRVLRAAFHGTRGGAALRSVDGSLDALEVERVHGTRRERLTGLPGPWRGRAAAAWAEALAHGAGFDPAVASAVVVHATLERIRAAGER